MTAPTYRPDTTVITSGRTGGETALAPTLYASTTFATPTVDEGRRMATDPNENHFYTRYGNPTIAAFEDAMAELKGAESARAFSSGMGAISAVVMGLCRLAITSSPKNSCTPGHNCCSRRSVHALGSTSLSSMPPNPAPLQPPWCLVRP